MARLPRDSFWGVRPARPRGRRPRITTRYNILLWKGRYPYGCRPGTRAQGGGSNHRGLDVGNVTGMKVLAWGPGYVISGGYDAGGYRTWRQVYYPRANVTVTYGHLLQGSVLPIGARVWLGRRIGLVGTRYDGITHPHVHLRAARGRWVRCIFPCGDMRPIIAWRACGLPG